MWRWYRKRRLKIKMKSTVENCEKFAYRSKRSAICPNAPQGQPSWILMRKRFPEIRANQISTKIEREFAWRNDLRKRHIYARINVRNVAMRNYRLFIRSSRICVHAAIIFIIIPLLAPSSHQQFKSRFARQRQTWRTGTCFTRLKT